MMAHGKLASPFIHGRRAHSAPASKSGQVAGAGERANSRTRHNAPRDGNHSSEHATRDAANKAWHATRNEQSTRNQAFDAMMAHARQLATQADQAEGAHKLALLWMAQGIAAEIARKQAMH